MRLFPRVTISFIIIMCFLSTSLNAVIPDLEANKDERSLSNPAYVLGQYWFRKLNGSRALIDFPPAYDYFRETLSQILPQTSLYNKTIEITFLNSSKSNAFVIPGSHMFIYSDIMETITNEDMLLGLLAHETAHLDLRHYERQAKRSGEELQKTLTLLGAGIAAAIAGVDSDATTALWLGGIANQAENTLTYSRNQEQEADRQGRQYLIEAELSPDGMNQLFQAFFKKALGRPKLEFLSTHPLPNTRLSDSFSIDKKESILNYRAISDFEYFRASLLAYRAGLEEKPYSYLDEKIQNDDAKEFAKGLFSYLIHSPERTLSFLKKIKQTNKFTDYLKVLSYAALNQTEASLLIINEQLELSPKNILFSMLYAQISGSRPANIDAHYLYEKRLIWRANIQHFQSKDNLAMALHYQSLLDFNQGKGKTARFLNKRAENDAKGIDKNIIREVGLLFEKIEEAEDAEDIDKK